MVLRVGELVAGSRGSMALWRRGVSYWPLIHLWSLSMKIVIPCVSIDKLGGNKRLRERSMRPFREKGMDKRVADDSKGSAARRGKAWRSLGYVRIHEWHACIRLLVFCPPASTRGIWSAGNDLPVASRVV